MTTKTKVCLQNHPKISDLIFSCLTPRVKVCILGVDRLSAWPILSILPIIDIGHFKNRFADNYFFFFLCKQTYYLQVTVFIGE